jgi:hypothetical protein
MARMMLKFPHVSAADERAALIIGMRRHVSRKGSSWGPCARARVASAHVVAGMTVSLERGHSDAPATIWCAAREPHLVPVVDARK